MQYDELTQEETLKLEKLNNSQPKLLTDFLDEFNPDYEEDMPYIQDKKKEKNK